MLKKNLGNIFLLLFMIFLMTSLHANEDIHYVNDVPYQVNRYGDIFPLWQNIPEQELGNKLLRFIEPFKETKQAIILQVAHEKSPILRAILHAGFTFQGNYVIFL